MTTPIGILVSSVTGGGDFRRLLEAIKLLFVSWLGPFSPSDVPGGVGSSVGPKAVDLTEGVRLCLVR